MEVHGIDPKTRGYRISFTAGGRTIKGLVPETLVAEWLRRSGTPEHGDAYSFIAAHRRQIEKSLVSMADGKTRIAAPYDRLSLLEE